jgi:hypothetical protein
MAWTLRLALVGMLVCGAVVAAVAGGASGGGQRSFAASFKLTAVTASECAPPKQVIGEACVDATGMVLSTKWTLGARNATWAPDGWTTTYQWSVPTTIGPGAAPIHLGVTADAHDVGLVCPAVGIRYFALEKAGESPDVSVCAHQGQSQSAAKTVSVLSPTSSPAYLLIGLSDGPNYVYKYTATTSSAGGGTSPANVSVKVAGEVSYRRGGTGPWVSLTPGTKLEQGDELQTGVDSTLLLHFPDGTAMELPEMTQVNISDLLVKASRMAVTVQLKLGEVSLHVNPNKSFQTDFEVTLPGGVTSVRGTVFTVFTDPMTKASIISTRQGLVSVNPKRSGLKTIGVPAGKEVELTPTTITPLSPIGKAGARGGINRLKAFQLVRTSIVGSVKKCGIQTNHAAGIFSVKPAANGWVVTVQIAGAHAGAASWRVTAGRARPGNALAQQLTAGCP